MENMLLSENGFTEKLVSPEKMTGDDVINRLKLVKHFLHVLYHHLL